MSLPCFIAKWIAKRALPVKIHPFVPVLVRGVPFFFLNVFKSEKLTACVVENTVNYYFDVIFMAKLCKLTEIFVGSQTAVHQLVIPGVIAMTG